ncbi:homoserine O-acetyltransferase MetX [Segetibacter aerophilus]|uniref:Homoserine O-acetyltransferase n=1 Tax=Segetibacter aerophilus TaxID=670293 RepID=A0A512BBB5_9BACT|nr:homoserine O-acetyltransferase [Segetibacter aerophilus]GEO09266.1 homoserine O-acetyltransferase [Segetibacter aerophilus]
MNYLNCDIPFETESGENISDLKIAYHTYGTLNKEKNNVVWVCHALTSNSAVTEWWPGLVGENCVINPDKYFIVCANIIGSCYGSTGPTSTNPATGKPYFSTFPAVTIRDMVKAHIILRQHLGVEKIHLLMAGSMGGYQALEWCAMESDKIENLFLITTSAAESAWGIAVHTAQRLAIEADSSWQDETFEAGKAGLKAARAIGLLTYRNYKILVERQTDPDAEKTDNFKASSYIIYQGDKLVKRFNAQSYWLLTKAMDSHNLARGRNKTQEEVLQSLEQRALIMGITSDLLCPVDEQKHIADNMPNATYIEIDSSYGHDGFLIEAGKISMHLGKWLSEG